MKELKKINKKAMTLLMILLMTFYYVFPLNIVHADNTVYVLSFSAQAGHTMENDNGHLKIDGQFVDLQHSGTNVGEVNCESTTSCSITTSTELPGELNYNANNQFTLYNSNGHVEYNMGTILNSNTVFMVEDYTAPQPQYEDITLNATFNNTSGEIIFNNDGSTRTPEGASYNGVIQNAGYTDSSQTNQITVNTSFGEPIATKITINGTDYDFTDNLDSHTIDVPGASTYTIVVQGDPSIVTPKTIIWTNPDYVPVDEEDAAWTAQFSIGHGYAKAIEVYDENNHLLDPSQYTNQQSDQYGLKDGFGWVTIMPGYRVVFDFVPEYGYQLTSININETPIEATNTMNRFEFTMPDGSGNIHFSATFTRTEDIVKANSEKISSGSIELGNQLDGGSAQLTVNDIELSADKIAGFQQAAGEYTISNYLDIDLYNVYYKGKNDANDVWSNKIDELDEEATITMKLQDGLTANDIVIVHNIHDGDQYEIIEIESYNPVTNTITFKTKSFSNYAIATKAGSSNNNSSNSGSSTSTTNPQTSDNIIFYLTALLISTLGMISTVVVVNKRKNIKND